MGSECSYSTKEVVPSSMLDEAHAPTDDKVVNTEQEDKQITENDTGPEVLQVVHRLTPDYERLYYPGNSDSEKTFSLDKIRSRLVWTRTRLVVAAVAIILIVVGAIVAGVLVSRQVAASHSVPAPNTPTDGQQRSIAAVSFEGANNSRVYFMTDGGQIVESSQIIQRAGWTVKKTGFIAGQNSRIAAAASRPGQNQEVTILYMDDSNVLHDIVSDSNIATWHEGDLFAQNIQPAQSSGLAVMYNWCALCANTTLIAFQDASGLIHIGNRTANGWKLTLLNSALNATMGSSLALQPFFRTSEPDQINLWTQKADAGNLVLSDWRSILGKNGGWNLNTFTFNALNLGASIAAAASYTRTPISGFETWIQILSTGSSGVNVDTWSGARNSFIAHQSTPAALQLPAGNPPQQMYGSLAMTSQGEGFAVMSQLSKPDSIVRWQVANDLLTWTPTGSVDLGGAWN